jgi:hypothetical protein
LATLLAGWLAATSVPARAGDVTDAKADSTAEPPSAAPAPVGPPTATAAAPVEPPAPKGRGIPLVTDAAGWGASIYGFAELDGMYDTTRSFGEGITNGTLARPNTYAGDNPRAQMTVRNSRLGLDVRAPEFDGIKTSGVIEMDFFGSQASSTENDLFANQVLRLRHFYVKIESSALDVLAGQYHDLFGWGGAGFYPNTVAFLPLLGEIYHRNPQLRLSKALTGPSVAVEMAVAVVRPVQRESAIPDVQGGLKLTLNKWRGASAQGAGRPTVAPFAIALSGVGRRLSVTDFSATPGNERVVYAGGAAANVFAPIIRARGDDLGNALSMSVEASIGTGINDLYPGLTGGVQFPSLPNPQNLLPVPLYVPNVDPGLVTYDSVGSVHTINWRALVVNLHYHLPFGAGKRVWVSGTFSAIQSTNALDLTPIQGQPFVWNKGYYADANVWVAVTPALQFALSGQRIAETFGDDTSAVNYRAEGACYFFF